jgi:hypothetical protein
LHQIEEYKFVVKIINVYKYRPIIKEALTFLQLNFAQDRDNAEFSEVLSKHLK